MIAFGLLLLLFGCKRTVEIEVPPLKGLPSGLVLKSRVVSSEPSKYTVEVDLHIVDNRGVPIRNIAQDGFTIGGQSQGNLDFGSVKLEKGLKTEVKGDYDVLFLMDQSGSITSTDRYDARIDAANFFLDNLGEGDRVGLASFQGSAYKIHNVIGRDVAGIRSSLEILRNSETGGTPLYYSTKQLVAEFEKMSTSTNKALIVFTDGDDTYGNSTPAQIIELAKQKGVAVHTVGLGAGLGNVGTLSNIANETGGYFMLAEDAEQLISYFGSLGNLLIGGASFYRLRFVITTPSPITRTTNFVIPLTVQISPVKTIKVFVPVTLP